MKEQRVKTMPFIVYLLILDEGAKNKDNAVHRLFIDFDEGGVCKINCVINGCVK